MPARERFLAFYLSFRRLIGENGNVVVTRCLYEFLYLLRRLIKKKKKNWVTKMINFSNLAILWLRVVY